jgi:hypothetical protein
MLIDSNCEKISKFAKINGIKPKEIDIIKEPYNGWKVKATEKFNSCPCLLEEIEHFIKNEVSV